MITYKIVDKLDDCDKLGWAELFAACFNTSVGCAEFIYRKYEINDARFCLIYSNEKLVASYSGLSLRTTNGLLIFLSTDTMSSGEVRGASILAASRLYSSLIDEGYDCVCGYPNKNIMGLRIAKLDWQVLKNVDLFMRVVPKGLLQELTCHPTFSLNRPVEGFFAPTPKIFKLGNNKGSLFAVELRLSSESLGFGFVNISNIIPKTRKYFCYRILRIKDENDIVRRLNELKLTEDSIDVP